MEVSRLKMLLGIPEEDITKDPILQFVLDDVEETVKNYCHLKELPTGLINTGYRMAIDLYRFDNPGAGDTPLTVSSISEGDTSTSFKNASDALTGSILKNYQVQLNRYRKLVK